LSLKRTEDKLDLLKSMLANRTRAEKVVDPKPTRGNGRKGPTKTERAKSIAAGSRAMRKFICEEKPPKKVMKEHLEAIIAAECASSSEED
jgi:hypothetical protein